MSPVMGNSGLMRTFCDASTYGEGYSAWEWMIDEIAMFVNCIFRID